MKKLKKLFSIMFVGLLVCVSAIGFCACGNSGNKDDSAKKAEMLNKVMNSANTLINSGNFSTRGKRIEENVENPEESFYVIDDYVVVVSPHDSEINKNEINLDVHNPTKSYEYSRYKNGDIMVERKDYETRFSNIITFFEDFMFLDEDYVTSYNTDENGNLRVEMTVDCKVPTPRRIDDLGKRAWMTAEADYVVVLDEADKIIRTEYCYTNIDVLYEEGFSDPEAVQNLENFAEEERNELVGKYFIMEYQQGNVSKEALEEAYAISFDNIDAMAIRE